MSIKETGLLNDPPIKVVHIKARIECFWTGGTSARREVDRKEWEVEASKLCHFCNKAAWEYLAEPRYKVNTIYWCNNPVCEVAAALYLLPYKLEWRR